MQKFVLYVARWQLSTPILWLVVSRLGTGLEATIIANLIGASIFFWVDKFIFRSGVSVTWELMPSAVCDDCGQTAKVQRLVLAPGVQSGQSYDRRYDPNPEYRCAACSDNKLRQLKSERRIAAVASPSGS